MSIRDPLVFFFFLSLRICPSVEANDKNVWRKFHPSDEDREAPRVTHLTSIPLLSGRHKAEGHTQQEKEKRENDVSFDSFLQNHSSIAQNLNQL